MAGRETVLMARFRDTRGEAAFQALYDHSAPRLLSWIVALAARARLACDARELLQDTFVNIYRYAGGFRDEEPRSFQAWSRTIAGNVVRRARASERGRRARTSLADLGEPPDPRPGPVSDLMRHESRASLVVAWMIVLSEYLEAYGHLSERERRALEWIEVRGWSYARAAADLGVGLSNLKMILFRARRKMRERIGMRLATAGRRRRTG